jgi:predicted transposase/invertase (TIGR01784 family)
MKVKKIHQRSKGMGLLPLDADILPPSDDRVFKLILTSPVARPVLADLISAIIMRPVVDVAVSYNEIPVEDTQEKSERFDVNCKTDDGTQIDLEMQASRIQEEADGEHRNLKGKGVYYLCDLHSMQRSKGEMRYDRLARTYQVTFCSYTVFPGREDFVNGYSMRHDKDGELLSDAIHAVYVELSKLEQIEKKPVEEVTELEKWAVFLQYASIPKHREKLNKVIETKEALQMAGELLMSVSQDERERAKFRSQRMYQTDLASDMATVKDIGRAEGRAEGRQEIINLLKSGKSIDEIFALGEV